VYEPHALIFDFGQGIAHDLKHHIFPVGQSARIDTLSKIAPVILTALAMLSSQCEDAWGVVRQLTIGIGHTQKGIKRMSPIFGPKMLFARKVSEVRPDNLLTF
jgi:hypothetical protein